MAGALQRFGALAAVLDGALLRAAALDAAAVLAPIDCSGCAAEDRSVCRTCVAALCPSVTVVDAARDPPLLVHCAVRYTGVARRVLLAFKESGRTDAAPVLARALTPAIEEALRCCGDRHDIEVATIPSTRAAYRVRGYHPTELVLSHVGVRASHPLRPARQTDDQAGLGLSARSANRSGSLVAAGRLERRSFILVDDIVTSGATLREARRAIHAAGGRVVGAAAIANTALLKDAR